MEEVADFLAPKETDQTIGQGVFTDRFFKKVSLRLIRKLS